MLSQIGTGSFRGPEYISPEKGKWSGQSILYVMNKLQTRRYSRLLMQKSESGHKSYKRTNSESRRSTPTKTSIGRDIAWVGVIPHHASTCVTKVTV